MRIPPPIVMFVFGVGMYIADLWISIWRFQIEIVSFILLGTAVVFLLPAVSQFILSKTTVHPFKAHRTSSLVTSGVYGVTRNPMYLGMLLVLVAWLFYLGNPLNLIFVVLFILYMNHFQISYEERVLREMFGSEYKAYSAKVRRWI